MKTVNIYLTFNGNCEAAFNFYKSIFGGEFMYMGRFADMPDGEGKPTDPEELNRIMHVGYPISQETFLFGSDITKAYESDFVQGTNFSISLTCDDKASADQYFNGLAQGGQITMPIGQTFWDEYFGMLTDKFGIAWMVGVKNENGEVDGH